MLQDAKPFVLTLDDLDRLGRDLPGHRVRGSRPDAPMMEGQFQLAKAPTGIQVHATDVTELEDFEVGFIAPAGLKLLVQLEGTTMFELAGQQRRIDADHGPLAELFVLSHPSAITRLCRAGMRVRKVMLTVTADWIEALPGPDGFAGVMAQAGTQGGSRWVPSAKALAAAEQLIASEADGGMVSQFERDRAALRILQEGISQLYAPDAPAPHRQSDAEKLEAAKAYIAAHLRPGLTTAQVAREVGVSERVLERLFRRHTGRTLGSYRRSLGLARARAALAHHGVSVAEAADLAGYGNPTSFAAAFQRAFGVTPSAVRGL